jgi:UrcA family protein
MKLATRIVPALATLLALGTSAAAHAAPSNVGAFATKTVRFYRSELTTAEGAQALYERIAAAARVVCRNEPFAAVRECRARAVDDAVRAVDSPLLSGIHGSAANRVEEVVLR